MRTVVYDDPGPGDYREELTDPKEQVTTFVFDELGRVTDVFDATPQAGHTQIDYDLRGNVTRLVDPEGAETYFERDAAYRVTRTDRPYAAGPLVTALDELGNPYRTTKPDGCEIETTFDAMNRMVARRSTSACPATSSACSRTTGPTSWSTWRPGSAASARTRPTPPTSTSTTC